jgi:branched-chain amino acid transport system ATP-binding protein
MATLMRVVDRVVVLDHGEKIAEGEPPAVAENPRVVEAYLGEKIVLA